MSVTRSLPVAIRDRPPPLLIWRARRHRSRTMSDRSLLLHIAVPNGGRTIELRQLLISCPVTWRYSENAKSLAQAIHGISPYCALLRSKECASSVGLLSL